MIKFGEWLPDQPDMENSGVTVATNVIPITFCFDSTTIKVRINVKGLSREDRIIPLEYIYW